MDESTNQGRTAGQNKRDMGRRDLAQRIHLRGGLRSERSIVVGMSPLSAFLFQIKKTAFLVSTQTEES
jgi:hypothetical protein